MSKRHSYNLPGWARELFSHMAEALVQEPGDLIIRDKESELVKRCEILLREMPSFNRFGFLFLLRVFNFLPVFFGFGLHRFNHLKPEAKSAYVDAWIATQNIHLKEIFKGLRGIVMMAYFSHPDVWAYIGYDPRTHVAERINLRRDIMTRNQSGGAA